MNFSQLIKTLVDYLDVGKRIATTIPGLALVFGFALLWSGPPEVFRASRMAREIQAEENQLPALQAAALAHQQTIDAANAESSLADEALSLYAEDRNKAVQAYKASPDAKTREALRLAQEAYREAWKRDRQSLEATKQKATADLEVTKSATATQKAKLDGLRTAYAASVGFTNGLMSLFNAAILAGLAGFAVGLLLEPINRALFLQFVPALGENRSERVRQLTGYYLVKPPQTRQTEFSTHYYIGRGLITQTEYDDLVASVYRLSEVTVGMIVPLLVITAGLLWRWDRVFPGEAGVVLTRLQQGAVLVASLALVWFLFRVGLKRYGEFRKQVYALIQGREEAFEEQRRQAEREAIAVQQAAAIRELKDVVRQLKGHDGVPRDAADLDDLPPPPGPTRRAPARGRS